MANILNGLSLTAIAEESLPVLQKILPPFEAFNTDFSTETAAAFAGISTRFPEAVTSSMYTRAAGYTTQNSNATASTMILGDVLHSVSAFTDFEVSTITLPRLMNTFLRGNMFAVANEVFRQITAPVLYATYGSASYTGSGFTFDNFYQGPVETLKTNGVTTQKAVILNSAYYGKLLSDVKQNYVIGDPTAIREGRIGRLGGVGVYEAPGLAANGESLVGFACGKEALQIASRLPVITVATGIEEVETVTEPESGFSLQLRLSRNPWTGLTYVGYYILVGYSQGNPKALTRITDGTRW